jgi:drug/metabolite transporter (DMT)-like permease
MDSQSEKLAPVSLGFLTLSLLFQAAASVLGKTAALHMREPSLSSFLTNPWYLGGLACLVFQAIAWQLVLREVRLFVAYLVTSLNYFLVLAASRILFFERISVANIAGAAVIVAGVYLVVREDLS